MKLDPTHVVEVVAGILLFLAAVGALVLVGGAVAGIVRMISGRRIR